MRMRTQAAPSFVAWLNHRAADDAGAARLVEVIGDLSTFPLRGTKAHMEACLVARGVCARDMEALDAVWPRYRAFLHCQAVLISLSRDEPHKTWRVLFDALRAIPAMHLRRDFERVVRRILVEDPRDVLPASELVLQALDDVQHARVPRAVMSA